MAEKAWHHGTVTFGATALGGCRTARLTWNVATADTTVAGDGIEQSITLNRVSGIRVDVSGIEDATAHHTWIGTRATLVVKDSTGATVFSAANTICLDPTWDWSYADADSYSLSFRPETVPTIPDFSYVTTLAG